MSESTIRTHPWPAVGAVVVALAAVVQAAAAPPRPTPTPPGVPAGPVSRPRPTPAPTPMQMAGSAPTIDADLGVDQLSVTPTRVTQGEQVNVTFRYSNNGRTQSVAFPCVVSYVGTRAVTLSNQPCPALGPGETRLIHRTVVIPTGQPLSGGEAIRVSLDVERLEHAAEDDPAERERKRQNNSVRAAITVLLGPGPDLLASSLEVGFTPDAWPNTLTFRIHNLGELRARDFAFQVRCDAVIAGRTVTSPHRSYAQSAIAAGQSVERIVSLNCPEANFITVQSFKFTVEVDTAYVGRLFETNERNNITELIIELDRVGRTWRRGS